MRVLLWLHKYTCALFGLNSLPNDVWASPQLPSIASLSFPLTAMSQYIEVSFFVHRGIYIEHLNFFTGRRSSASSLQRRLRPISVVDTNTQFVWSIRKQQTNPKSIHGSIQPAATAEFLPTAGSAATTSSEFLFTTASVCKFPVSSSYLSYSYSA